MSDYSSQAWRETDTAKYLIDAFYETVDYYCIFFWNCSYEHISTAVWENLILFFQEIFEDGRSI